MGEGTCDDVSCSAGAVCTADTTGAVGGCFCSTRFTVGV
jgi:hypothetical protein